MKTMKLLKIFADEQGDSHLREDAWPLQESDFTPPSPAGYLTSAPVQTNEVLMMHHPAGYRDVPHRAPKPVLGIVLRGQVRITTSDGDHRTLGAGDQFLALDLNGKGHRMDEINDDPYDLALVVLKDVPPQEPDRSS